ncbi:hypothetical protein D3C74_475110 [compost metagenome]
MLLRRRQPDADHFSTVRILTVRFHMQRGNAREGSDQCFQFGLADDSDIQYSSLSRSRCFRSGSFTVYRRRVCA